MKLNIKQLTETLKEISKDKIPVGKLKHMFRYQDECRVYVDEYEEQEQLRENCLNNIVLRNVHIFELILRERMVQAKKIYKPSFIKIKKGRNGTKK